MTEKQESDDKTEGPRSFAHVLTTINHGSFEGELSEELHRLLEVLAKQASAVGKAKGKISITLGIHVAGSGIVHITADQKVIEPKVERGESVFWLTKGGNLSKTDPKQQLLGLREVAPSAAARDAGAQKPAVST